MEDLDGPCPAKRGRRGRGRGRGGQGGTKKRGSGHSSHNRDDDDDLDLELVFATQSTFSLEDKLNTDKFQEFFIIDMLGKDFTVSYIQKNGFANPIRIKEKTGLDIKIPKPGFTVSDVRQCVGSRRTVDVMDVSTQRNLEMTMKEWEQYYTNPAKDRLLNVISLEFSHTKLDSYVQPPIAVRQIDWVEIAWPRALKAMQKEATNALDEMWYPKVQKYCLMSVAGCYTDFHIDFGGTSVWYHILRGSKVFWLIPPTERNLQLYEQWTLSGKQSDIFFGDLVEKCARVNLQSGNTFMIPSGWIHAVYTPTDSLVFGGNFLHSYAIETQLRSAQVEESTRVPAKFRFPFFTEMLWYVLERYVYTLLGKSHLDLSQLPEHAEVPNGIVDPGTHVHLTSAELHGLRAIVLYLHSLPPTRKNVPDLLSNPVALIHDVRTLVEQHRNDQTHLAITGVPVIGYSPVVKVRKSLLDNIKQEKVDSLDPKPSISAEQRLPVIKTEPKSEPEDDDPVDQKPILMKSSPFPHLQNQLKQQQQQQQQQQRQDIAKKMRAPICVVRPTSIGPCDPRTELRNASGKMLSNQNRLPASELILKREVLIPVFQRLSVKDLLVCMRVCRSWNRCTIDPSLWPVLDLSHEQLTPIVLAGIVRRQTPVLIFDWSSVNNHQLTWLMDRLPKLSTLSFQGCSAAVLAALRPSPVSPAPFMRCSLPKLSVLDLSWVSGINDVLLERTLLQSGTPNHRLSSLKQLALAGSELTDKSLSGIASAFPQLENFCLAFCPHYTASCLETLLTSNESFCHLSNFDLTGCNQLVDVRSSLEHQAVSSRPSLQLLLDFTADSKTVHRCLRFK